MSGAAYLGLILLVGGALLDWASFRYHDQDRGAAVEETSLFRALTADRKFTRTSRLLQALGTVLVVIGLLAMML